MKIAWTAVAFCVLVPLGGCGEEAATDERSTGEVAATERPSGDPAATETPSDAASTEPPSEDESTGDVDDMTHPEVLEAWDRGEYDPPVDMNGTDEEYVELLQAQAPDAFAYMDAQEIVRKAVGVCTAAWSSITDAYEGSVFAEGFEPEVQLMVDEAFNYYCPEVGERLQ